jgi:hypothetical protein
VGAVAEGGDQVGVCILRVRTRDDGLVIGIRTRTDVEAASTERACAVADVDAALRLVRAFLLEMATTRPAGRAPPDL